MLEQINQIYYEITPIDSYNTCSAQREWGLVLIGYEGSRWDLRDLLQTFTSWWCCL